MFTKFTISKKREEVPNNWYLIDADGLVLGRLASFIAKMILGKHKVEYTSHNDTGDSIVVINADKIKLTGRKWKNKIYYRHSGYMGGLKEITAEKLHEKSPESLIYFAVQGMLPKNTLGRKLNKKLKVYVGEEHPHKPQNPELIKIN